MITAEKIAFDLDCEIKDFKILEFEKVCKCTCKICLEFDLKPRLFALLPNYRIFELITTENNLYISFKIEL